VGIAATDLAQTIRAGIFDVLRAHPQIAVEEGTAGLPTAFRAWVGNDGGAAIGIIMVFGFPHPTYPPTNRRPGS